MPQISWFQRHVHQWAEVDRARLPGANVNATGIEGAAATEALLRTAQDRTSVRLRCSECGELTERILLGWKDPKDVTTDHH